MESRDLNLRRLSACSNIKTFARRNIIMRPDGSFCLVDWEHAGFYPRIFAAYCLGFVGIFDGQFSYDLMEALEKLWPKTEMLNRVYQNNLRYS